MINILYLIYKKLIDLPVLYLSSYIIRTKSNYYELLQKVRDEDSWEEWIIYMLKGIELTSKGTIELIKNMHTLMMDYKHRIRDKYKFYSQDLLNNLFKHPYTKIEFIQNDLKVHRQTASSYLEQLVEGGFLKLEKIGRENIYINEPLFKLFADYDLFLYENTKDHI